MFAKELAKPQSIHDRIKYVNDNGMARLMTAGTAQINHNILDQYIEQARAHEIAVASVTALTALPLQPPRSDARRGYVSNTTSDDEDEEDDDAPAPAPTLEKLSAISDITSRPHLGALDQLAQLLMEDELNRQTRSDEEEVSEYEPEPVPVRSSSRLTAKAARSKTSKPIPETKSKSARKAVPSASPPPSKPARKAAPPGLPTSKMPQDHQQERSCARPSQAKQKSPR